MEILPELKTLSSRIEQLKENISTEEATKTAFVLPFIKALGYDIFNPTEVLPEYTTDLGIKKGEKVDYAIMINGSPAIIVECKHWKEDLNVHNSQLHRYFHVSKAKFGLLTNGIEYRFYTDLVESNKMDDKPFLEFRMNKLKDTITAEIAKFHKSNFDADKIFDNASALKYMREIRGIFEKEVQEPSSDFVRLFAAKVYNGRLTEKVQSWFTELVQKSVNQYISDKVNDRLTAAISKENEVQSQVDQEEDFKSKVETTEEELEAFNIVLAIGRKLVGKERIAHRDTQSYLGILLDDNNRKPICRLHLNGGKKYIGLFDSEKKEIKQEIDSIDDIYKFEKEILACISAYIEEPI